MRDIIYEMRPDVIVDLMASGVTPTANQSWIDFDATARFPAFLAECIDPQNQRLIHATTALVDGDEGVGIRNRYVQAKRAGLRELRRQIEPGQSAVSILTLHNVYGVYQPNGRLIADVVTQLSQGETFNLKNPWAVRDFAYIRDVCDVFRRVVEEEDFGEAEIDVGTGIGTALLNVAQMIAFHLGANPDLIQCAADDQQELPNSLISTAHPGDIGYCPTKPFDGFRQIIAQMTTAGRRFK